MAEVNERGKEKVVCGKEECYRRRKRTVLTRDGGVAKINGRSNVVVGNGAF